MTYKDAVSHWSNVMSPRFTVKLRDHVFYVHDSMWPDNPACVLYFRQESTAQNIADMMNEEWKHFLMHPEI